MIEYDDVAGFELSRSESSLSLNSRPHTHMCSTPSLIYMNLPTIVSNSPLIGSQNRFLDFEGNGSSLLKILVLT